MTNRHKRPTIKQVALRAGVSTQTVSRVMNNRPDVSPETRERVQHIIDALGYRPSALARSLIQQRSYTLGVVTAGLKYIGPSRTLSGITNAAGAFGYSLLLKELPDFTANHVEPVLEEFASRHVDGVIWAVPEVGENRTWVRRSPPALDVPVVFLTMQPQEDLPVVSVDNYQGGLLAANHLLEQGYRRIGHIAGPLDWWEARERKQAWADSLRNAGMRVSETAWVEGNWSPASGEQGITQLLERFPDIDAVFAANDQMALGVIQAACRKGLRIPEDLGVVGFDNIPESPFFCPPLTTIHSEQEQVGKVAVERIIQIIDPERLGDSSAALELVTLAPSLIVRQSSLRGGPAA